MSAMNEWGAPELNARARGVRRAAGWVHPFVELLSEFSGHEQGLEQAVHVAGGALVGEPEVHLHLRELLRLGFLAHKDFSLRLRMINFRGFCT